MISKEWNHVYLFWLSRNHEFFVDSVLVSPVCVQNEWCSVHRATHALIHAATTSPALKARAHAGCTLMSDRVARSVLPEEFRVSERRVCECSVVIFGTVKIFTETRVSVRVIFGALNVEVADPSQFTIDIAILCNFRVFRNASAFDFIFVVRVHSFLLAQLTDFAPFSLFEIFVKILLVKVVVITIVGAGGNCVSMVPASVG